ncbi:thiamine phosphate synthase, partial [bacterium]
MKIKDYSLYLVISSEYGLGRPVLEIAKSAIAAGVDIIQLREKNKDKNELIELACELKELCHKAGVIFIVNDDPYIAKASGADGVHLGQEDLSRLSVNEVRGIITEDKIIGVSTHSLDEVRKANSQNINYIAYGPVFATETKKYFLGTKDVKEVLSFA